MLSSEGNEKGEKKKTAIGLISKKATLHVQHTFFVHFLAVVLHDYNVKLPETSWLHVLLQNYKIFTFFFQRKNVSFVFYLSLCLSLLFSLSFAGLSPTFSFSLSPSSLYSKFVDMTINLSLILSRTRIQKKFRLY